MARIEADIFADGHDLLRCEVRYRHDADTKWSTTEMTHAGNDHWIAVVPVVLLGRYRFSIRARPDPFATWSHELSARADAGQELDTEFQIGAQLIDQAASRARGSDKSVLARLAAELRLAEGDLAYVLPEEIASWIVGNGLEQGPPALLVRDAVFSEKLVRLMGELSDGARSASSETFAIAVDPAKARFSTWYEMFPRSAASDASRHGTFADVREKLDYVAQMGFDVLYLPPIHPIGRTGRKGREGTVTAGTDDPGSPWAIGGAEGGHTAIHPDLGTLGDFRDLVANAAARGIDVAIDLAFQASPDHPWVQEHPEWFRHRPDGTIRYAENPPKRYEDIYPLDFDTSDWQALWTELLEVVRYWIAQGVKVFRVDNPHTKPFAFWEWLLATIRSEAPETIFLAEAFTRPRVMEQLAKIGFTQSYTYFTWRNSKWELESYFNELTSSPVADFFRPNLWPNTPDILSDELQRGGRAAFLARLVLAATLGASYGIYGPAFELQEHAPRAAGSEEYSRSEKYEIRSWTRKSKDSLAAFIGLVNKIRREHLALQFNDTLRFHAVDNEQIIAYSKSRLESVAGRDIVVTVVNLDHYYPQAGWVELDLGSLGVDARRGYVMHDLLTDARYSWQGNRNFVRLDPADVPCHVFSLEQEPPRELQAEGNGSR
jgi:starch synthase (maltosyl-transferring)